jgi:hypothetical protein
MNANIKKTHILCKMKYDLKGHISTNKTFYVYLFSSNNSSVKPTLPLMLSQIVCALVIPIPTKVRWRFPICSLDVETQIKIKYDIKARFHVATFMFWRVYAILKKCSNLLIKIQPDLRSYGQLLSLFILINVTNLIRLIYCFPPQLFLSIVNVEGMQ